ncbi:MAG TPA: mechanosensitive ion channel family protein [Terriglobia bacterium]|nr:mechanosensitive ion channel family protein [Terriglobia bacterium]
MRARTFVWAAFLALAGLQLSQSAHGQAGGKEGGSGPEAQADRPTAFVTVDGRALFRVVGVSAYPAEKRAEAIAKRIMEIANDPSVSTDSLRAAEVEAEQVTNILAGDRFIMAVTDADVSLERAPRPLLTRSYMMRINEAVTVYRQDRSPRQLLINTGYALGATVVLGVVLVLLYGLFRRLDALAEKRLKSKVEGLRIQSFQVVQTETFWKSVRTAFRTVRTLAMLACFLLYAQVVLGFYPWTRPTAERLLLMLLDPLRNMALGFIAMLPNLAFLAILFVVVRYLLRLMRLFFSAIEHGTVTFSGFEREWALPTFRMVRVLVVAFALVVGYPYLPGSQSEAFKGASILLGVMFSLGSSSAIANIIAGYSLTYRRAYRVGDRVMIGDVLGDVAEMRLQVTHLRSLKNEEIVIPNSTIMNSHVINYSSLAAQHGLILHTTVGIGYETPWRQVEAMLIEAAGRTPGLLREPPPFVLQKSLGDFAVTYEINVYTDQPQAGPRLYAALHRSILDVFNEYGVQIMTPAYEGDPEQAKLVPKDKWFELPARPEGSAGDSRPNATAAAASETRAGKPGTSGSAERAQ